jgi:hypothetical protein
MKKHNICHLVFLLLLLLNPSIHAQEIPLPEHPRPDFQREQWQNLNGTWAFAFDAQDKGIQEGWAEGETVFDKTILVPFPWGSNLLGIQDEADIGWYQREIIVDQSWQGKRIFLTVGASDWETSIWLDGTYLGKHQGGYVPFSFELTDHVKFGEAQKLIIRADDARREFTLYGKQGYGNARGIWQTVYLEARGDDYLDALHFASDIDNNKVKVTAYLSELSDDDISLSLTITGPADPINHLAIIPAGKNRIGFDIDIPDPRLWNLEDPYLYQVEAVLEEDVVRSYFGMRKISVVNLPGTDYPYIALNDEPVYLQLALDQSYHPDGFYTFPSDQFMKEEIIRSKSIGLNGIRTHIKVEVPRKLYWADKLGLLVMEDLPNSWGEPDEKMRSESAYTLRGMINTFRTYPRVGGWLYTEHHDVINEWNGYWRFDRTEKMNGLGEIMEGMSLKNLHADVYLSTGVDICKTVNGGEHIEVPLYLSVMTGKQIGDDLIISYELSTTNYIGETEKYSSGSRKVAYTPWMQKPLAPLTVQVPDMAGLATLKLKVTDRNGQILHRNFMHFEIISDQKIPGVTVLSTPVDRFSRAGWSKRHWNVLDGRKVNGAGKGFFQYTIPLPEDLSSKGIKETYFLVEVSAKEYFVKDQQEYEKDQDFMRGSRVAPSANPNAYPMTDEQLYPSEIAVSIDGREVYSTILPDDPADHRGVLSWHHQLKDRKLREAGSYGYLIKVPVKKAMLKNALEKGALTVRLQTLGEGGIAVYGKQFGRYPLDPSLVLKR